MIFRSYRHRQTPYYKKKSKQFTPYTGMNPCRLVLCSFFEFGEFVRVENQGQSPSYLCQSSVMLMNVCFFRRFLSFLIVKHYIVLFH